MHIKITNKEEQELIKQFAMKKQLPYTKAIVEAVRIAENEIFLKGKIATLQFLYKLSVQQQLPKQKSVKKK